MYDNWARVQDRVLDRKMQIAAAIDALEIEEQGKVVRKKLPAALRELATSKNEKCRTPHPRNSRPQKPSSNP